MNKRRIPKTITDVYVGDNKIGTSYDRDKLYIELLDEEGKINVNLVFGDGEYIATLMYLDMKTGIFVREKIPDSLRHVIAVDSEGKMKVL